MATSIGYWICGTCYDQFVGEYECFTDTNILQDQCAICRQVKGTHHLTSLPPDLLHTLYRWIDKVPTAEEETLLEIKTVFDSLRIKSPPDQFLMACKKADCRPDVALDALKEFALANDCFGDDLIFCWNITMAGKFDALSLMNGMTRDEMEMQMDRLLRADGIGGNILEDESSLNLIRVKLGRETPSPTLPLKGEGA